MRHMLLLVLATLGMAAGAFAEGEDPIAGEWILITTFRGDEMESKLVVTRAEDGTLSARYTDSGGTTTALGDFRYESGKVTWVRSRPRGTIGFEGKVAGERLVGNHVLGGRRIPAVGARGEAAIAALRAERKAATKANERGDDLEADYERNSRRAAPRDAFPVLFDPTLTPAADAKDIRDDEPVIGVALGGEAKAYPISIMGRHELANDTCGGIPIAASW